MKTDHLTTGATADNDQDEEDRPNLACPHCRKQFSTAAGREYHISHFMCRPELKSARTKRSPGSCRRKRSASTGDEESSSNSEGDRDSSESDTHYKNKPEIVERTSSGRAVRRRFTKLSYSSNSSDDDDEKDAGSDNDKPAANARDKSKADKGRVRPSSASENIKKRRRSGDDDDDAKENGAAKVPLESDALSPEDRQCSHCSRTFTSFLGLKYHVDKLVCRPESRPGGPAPKGRRKASSGGSGSGGQAGPKYKRIRGSLGDRTCPKCKRVFTSVLGLQYHTERRVCDAIAAFALARSQPFHRLSPGQEFVTPFGVVRVVKDDRGPEPTGQLPDDVDKLARQWRNARLKRAAKLDAKHATATGTNLFRRRTLRDLYDKGLISARSVEDAYKRSSHVEEGRESSERFVFPDEAPDPEVPRDSFPDRIVECAFIPDEREQVTMDRDGVEEVFVCSNAGIAESRIYVRRRDLSEAYVSDDVTFTCGYCGQTFASKPGASYHLRSGGCDEGRVNSAKEAYRQRLQDIQRRSEFLERMAKAADVPAPAPNDPVPATNSTAPPPKSTKRASRVKDLAVYPQVWLSLRFKLLPRSDATTKEGKVSAFPATRAAEAPLAEQVPMVVPSSSLSLNAPRTKEAKLVADPNKHPRVVLENLRQQLLFEESRAIGPMYPGVYAALKYEEFDPLKSVARLERERRENKKLEKQKRKRVKAQMRRVKEEVANAPKIDVQVIVGDLQAGRFPSFVPYTGDHDSVCYLCRQDGDVLHGCDYCRQSLHYACLCRKWNVRKPEPCAGFLCHTCIGQIVTRRVRAEKRLTDKGADTRDQALIASKLPLLNSVVEGREYECLEAQGQRLSDVAVLLADAESRLTESLGVATLNTLRLSMIDPSREITRDL